MGKVRMTLARVRVSCARPDEGLWAYVSKPMFSEPQAECAT